MIVRKCRRSIGRELGSSAIRFDAASTACKNLRATAISRIRYHASAARSSFAASRWNLTEIMAVTAIDREALPTEQRRPSLRCADPARRRTADPHPTTRANLQVTYQADDWRLQDGRIRGGSAPHSRFRRVLPACVFPCKGRNLNGYQTTVLSILTNEQSRGEIQCDRFRFPSSRDPHGNGRILCQIARLRGLVMVGNILPCRTAEIVVAAAERLHVK